MKKITLAFTAIGLALAGTQAAAEEKAVSYADLNLSTVEGQQALERRITQVIEDVCKSNEIRTGTRMRSRDVRQCEIQAKASAKQQVAAIVEREGLGG